MSKLNIDQKNVKSLFQDSKSIFLIPDYQRPYAWGLEECKTLWEDLFSFAFPNDNYDNFNSNDEYFLGPIVLFKNENGKMEIIDGQQRLTTLMILLRGFYNKLGFMKDKNSQAMKTDIEKCLWKADMFGKYKKDDLKINSEVATDNDKEEFLSILKDGDNKNMKSKYSENFNFFKRQIEDFSSKYPTYFAYFPAIILNNCVLLPIEAESQDTALRIFSTLNDRGKPLSDADIFKAQLYKYYTTLGEKEIFISKWKELESIANKIFHPTNGSPLDELFTRYMYYERAKMGIKSSTTESLRKFYERNNYSLFKNKTTLANLEQLVSFWQDINNQDEFRFSKRILRCLYILNAAPNGMWTYIVSVYFMQNKNTDGTLEEQEFFKFLNIITAFIWAYALTNPGVNSLRTPIYAEMIKIVNGNNITFEDFKFEEKRFRSMFSNYAFTNNRAITKSMLTWWAFTFDGQELLSLETQFDIEHIYSKGRQQKESGLTDPQSIELLGNKSLLERRINIRASDYRFEDKIKYYEGFNTKKGTQIDELFHIYSKLKQFTEKEISDRNQAIIDKFIKYLNDNNLLKEIE